MESVIPTTDRQILDLDDKETRSELFRGIFDNLFLYGLVQEHGKSATLERVLLDRGLLDEYNREYEGREI